MPANITKAQLRAARKAAKAAGRPWSVELGPNGLEIVRERTPAEERAHALRMDRWARRIDLDPDWR